MALTFLTGRERRTESAERGHPTKTRPKQVGPARQSLGSRSERASQRVSSKKVGER